MTTWMHCCFSPKFVNIDTSVVEEVEVEVEEEGLEVEVEEEVEDGGGGSYWPFWWHSLGRTGASCPVIKEAGSEACCKVLIHDS